MTKRIENEKKYILVLKYNKKKESNDDNKVSVITIQTIIDYIFMNCILNQEVVKHTANDDHHHHYQACIYIYFFFN